MEDFYRLNPGVISSSEIDVNVVHQVENMATSTSNTSCGFHGHPHHQGHVGAPPEMKSLLEEIGRVSHPMSTCSEIGADPELDEFMESYCEVLRGYKEELSKPFDEATNFLTNIQSQLRNLCKGTFPKTSWDCNSDEGVGSSEEEFSCGEVEAAESQETAAARAGGDGS
ncbi:homeobox protein knotted-1-like 1 [Prunus yedoensis var. nudiflora]|uniref:Homeobox protein knotted-1-like 1 n=1 Tax=Prunus yedoensis var. nudiflora TaxID=2094558 RepID=A0A314XWS3_PRUYE|nr:homeobox protein knotted-1-like 1 [Prunus yedoensis var. nudiflora]